ncbi:hypothetical protein B0H10DRAFT_1960514 [Mycena sp. CBHHK59/15]|nr:hypothetical protein B0H10DRAFT_1960514 [Mycena sp. CBHHK59/15]
MRLVALGMQGNVAAHGQHAQDVPGGDPGERKENREERRGSGARESEEAGAETREGDEVAEDGAVPNIRPALTRCLTHFVDDRMRVLECGGYMLLEPEAHQLPEGGDAEMDAEVPVVVRQLAEAVWRVVERVEPSAAIYGGVGQVLVMKELGGKVGGDWFAKEDIATKDRLNVFDERIVWAAYLAVNVGPAPIAGCNLGLRNNLEEGEELEDCDERGDIVVHVIFFECCMRPVVVSDQLKNTDHGRHLQHLDTSYGQQQQELEYTPYPCRHSRRHPPRSPPIFSPAAASTFAFGTIGPGVTENPFDASASARPASASADVSVTVPTVARHVPALAGDDSSEFPSFTRCEEKVGAVGLTEASWVDIDEGWTPVTRKTSRTHRERRSSSNRSEHTNSNASDSGSSSDESESTVARATNEMSSEELDALVRRHEAILVQYRAALMARTPASKATTKGQSTRDEGNSPSIESLAPEVTSSVTESKNNSCREPGSHRVTMEEIEDEDEFPYLNQAPKSSRTIIEDAGEDLIDLSSRASIASVAASPRLQKIETSLPAYTGPSEKAPEPKPGLTDEEIVALVTDKVIELQLRQSAEERSSRANDEIQHKHMEYLLPEDVRASANDATSSSDAIFGMSDMQARQIRTR